MKTRIVLLEDLISKLHGVKDTLEKDLGYDWVVTDDVQTIIEALEHDLGDALEREYK